MKKFLVVLSLLMFVQLAHPASLSSKTTIAVVPMMFQTGTIPTVVLSAPPPTVYTGILFKWTYTANPAVPACPTTGTPIACYNGFTLTDTTTNTVLATPATAGATAVSYQWKPTGGLYYGTHTFSLVANYYDSLGNAQVSAATEENITNNLTSLAPPTGFTASGTSN